MTKKNYTALLVIVVMLIFPVLGTGLSLQHETLETSVGIVYTNNHDASINLAIQTIEQGVNSQNIDVYKTSLNDLDGLSRDHDLVIIVGHGLPEGLETQDGILEWSMLYEELGLLKAKRTVVLACNSPSNQDANIFGFDGQIDAIAGGLIVSLMIRNDFTVEKDLAFYFQQIDMFQERMNHPLGRYVYFVHGFFGSDDAFNDMINWLVPRGDLSTYTQYRYFSYFDAYDADTPSEQNAVHWQHDISEFASNFADELLNLPAGSQVSIVAHSMGGIIVREMLRLEQDAFDAHDIDFGRVITLGSPHLGTQLANPLNPWELVLLVSSFVNGEFWPSPVFWSLDPNSILMQTLNQEAPYIPTQSYLIGGIDLILGPLMSSFIGGNPISDGVVPLASATGIWATDTESYNVGHDALVDGATTGRLTYSSIASWLNPSNDFDGDGLTDEEERYYYGTNKDLYDTDQDGLSDGQEVLTYGTNPCDSDSDNDGLSDGSEVNTYGTNPLDATSDGDIINDGTEVVWGYNPLNSNDPIPASSLIYSAWQAAGKAGYVRANHYTAMDYVKVYVKYKTSSGYWTGYTYVGSDSTPTYSGDYYVSWGFLSVYVQMKINVEAYDSSNHYLGSDVAYVTLPGGGGDLPD